MVEALPQLMLFQRYYCKDTEKKENAKWFGTTFIIFAIISTTISYFLFSPERAVCLRSGKVLSA